MVTEKIDAMEETKKIIIRGGDPSLVISSTRRLSQRMWRDCQALNDPQTFRAISLNSSDPAAS